MKKSLPILAGMLMMAGSASAQITLTQSNYPSSIIGTDSLKMTTATSAFPSLSPAADGAWDMSVVTDTTPVFFAYRVPTATYQFADSNNYSFSGFGYQGNVQSSITSGGLFEYAIIIPRTAYSLYAITSGPTDSFIINTQTATFSSAREKIAFPANYHAFWQSVYEFDIDFQISAVILSLTNAPGIIRTYTTEKDSVVGWGKMKVKDALGNPSPYQDILQVQTTITTIDSIFINGVPAVSSALLPLGLTQGKKDTTYQQNYYRAEEVTALAQVTFRDAAFMQPYHATTHVQRLLPSSVENVIRDANINVFPNPVMNRFVSIELPADGAWDYTLSDINGQKVSAGSLNPIDKKAELTLPAFTQGMYYLKLSNSSKQIVTKTIEVDR